MDEEQPLCSDCLAEDIETPATQVLDGFPLCDPCAERRRRAEEPNPEWLYRRFPPLHRADTDSRRKEASSAEESPEGSPDESEL